MYHAAFIRAAKHACSLPNYARGSLAVSVLSFRNVSAVSKDIVAMSKLMYKLNLSLAVD
jgi:hypothetical protein